MPVTAVIAGISNVEGLAPVAIAIITGQRTGPMNIIGIIAESSPFSRTHQLGLRIQICPSCGDPCAQLLRADGTVFLTVSADDGEHSPKQTIAGQTSTRRSAEMAGIRGFQAIRRGTSKSASQARSR